MFRDLVKSIIAGFHNQLLAKANFHFAQEATLINILEFSLSETYAPKEMSDQFTAVRQCCVGGCDNKYKG